MWGRYWPRHLRASHLLAIGRSRGRWHPTPELTPHEPSLRISHTLARRASEGLNGTSLTGASGQCRTRCQCPGGGG
jgi:hypothetical protein